MLNPKKHPLEIFRARGGHGPLVRRGGADSGEPPSDGSGPPPTEHRRWEPQPFELRLSLLGALVLAIAWIVLLAGAYSLGVHRGRVNSQFDSDAQAKERGRQIESGVDEAKSVVPPATSQASAPARPYGVLVLTYSKGAEPEIVAKRVGELKKTFEERYQIPAADVVAWPLNKTGETVVYVGVFDDKDDPALQQLSAKLRQIADWPYGNKNPFATAAIRAHPNDPKKYPKPADATPSDKN